jgi:hypothetical protein
VSRSGQPSQSATLEQLACLLAAGQVHAVTIDAAERGIEGNFYHARSSGAPSRRPRGRRARRTSLSRAGGSSRSCGTSTRRARGPASTHACLCRRSAGSLCRRSCELRASSFAVARAARVAACACCRMTRRS